MTTVQKIAIPKVLEGGDLLLVSDTGTGKTEAALLPVLSKILDEKPKEISTLYITPLKALNRDLLSRILWWTEKLGIEVSVRHGDTSSYIRKQQAEFPPQILILTVETLQPILVGAKIRELLRNVRWVILDEIHELVGSKRGVQLSLGLERLRKIANFQTLMLSATVFDEEETGKFFSHNFNVIKVLSEKKKEVKVVCPEKKKEDIEEAKKVRYNIQKRVRGIMFKIEEDNTLFENICSILRIEGRDNIDKALALNEYAKEHPNKIIDVFNDKNLNTKALIERQDFLNKIECS